MSAAKPILHGAPLSPFVRKVSVVMAIKRIDHEFNLVLPFRDNEVYDRLNPMRKVPMYEDEDLGTSDSSVIIDYLERVHPEPAVYPKSAASRARALWYEEYADTALADGVVRTVFFERLVKPAMMGEEPDETRVEKAIAERIPGYLDFLEKRLGDQPFLVDGAFGIADISVSSMFINASYAGFVPDAGRWPRFSAWMERVRQVPEISSQLDEETAILASMQPSTAGN